MDTSKSSFNDAASLVITRQVSGMPFFWWSCLCIAAWMLWNALAPVPLRFDPSPAFVLLLMILNIGQWLFLSALGNGQAVLQRSDLARQQENDQILRNGIVTMNAVKNMIEQGVLVSLKAIQEEIAD